MKTSEVVELLYTNPRYISVLEDVLEYKKKGTRTTIPADIPHDAPITIIQDLLKVRIYRCHHSRQCIIHLDL